MIVSPQSIFFEASKLIETELEKIGKYIIGMRFFNFIHPEFRHFTFDSEKHFVARFPKHRTYSMIVFARRGQEHEFSWK